MKNPSSFVVGLLEYSCSEKIESNVLLAKDFIRQAAAQGAQIICLPELFHSLYFCGNESYDNFALAHSVPGKLIEEMQAVAREKQVVLVVPFFERRAPGLFHNSAAVIDADGSLLGLYRKMHIPDDPLYLEKFYFTPGDAPQASEAPAGYQVFQTRYARVGVLICWDQWYPEAARITALKGAEIIFYPTAIGWHPAEKKQCGAAQLDAWRTMQRAHAISNGIFVAAVNRVGHEPTPGTDGIEFFGHSFVCDPFGRYLADKKDMQPGIALAECRRSLIEETRVQWPFLRDRRIESYQPITARYLQGRTIVEEVHKS